MTAPSSRPPKGSLRALGGHYWDWLLMTPAFVYALLGAASLVSDIPLMAVFVIEVLVMPSMFIAVRLAGQHATWDCPRCAKERPVDGAQEVLSNLDALRLAHDFRESSRVGSALFILAMLMVLAGCIAISGGVVGAMVWSLCMAVAAVIVLRVTRIHDRLQPWCPRCPQHEEAA